MRISAPCLTRFRNIPSGVMEDLTNTCSKYPHLLASASGFMASGSPSIYRMLHTKQLRGQKITLNQVGIFDWNLALLLQLAVAAKEFERNSSEKTNYPQISLNLFQELNSLNLIMIKTLNYFPLIFGIGVQKANTTARLREVTL